MTTGMTIFSYAADFEQARGFFQSALGVEPRDAGPNWTMFPLGDSNFALHRMPSEPQDPTAVHLDFIVDDLDQGLARFQEAGAEVLRGVADEPWGRTAIVKDPEGRRILLVEYED